MGVRFNKNNWHNRSVVMRFFAGLGTTMSLLMSSPIIEATQSRIRKIEQIALNVVRLELEPADPNALFATCEAGAHIDVALPNGLVRQYSLVNPGDSQRYVIAVGLDANSRGGSACIHHDLNEGDELALSLPRNHFPLQDCSRPVVLVAGGIGITPIWSMVQTLEQRQQSWVLYYCARTPEHAAFLDDITTLAEHSSVGQVVPVFDQVQDGKPLDLAHMFAKHGAQARFYCCGPTGLLDAFVTTAQQQGIPDNQVHIERFSATENTGENQPFDVVLNDGSVHHIPADKSILEVLIEAGEPVMYFCMEGTCGTCETHVISGDVEHRDAILTPEEKKGNHSMMICVSRCAAGKLTLDI